MRINHNIAALNTYRQLSTNGANTSKALEKLSSGLRINKAGDDAAGLAISEKMRGQIRGLDQAARNSQDAISMIQTAEGALNETHSILQRMRELATQAANDTNTSTDRNEIQKEINQLTSEINRIGNTTEFNTRKILNGDINVGTGSTIDMTDANKPVYTGTTFSNLKAASNSTAATGSYEVKVENLGGKDSFDVGASQNPDGTASTTNKVTGTDTQLTAGSYSVEVKTEDAMTIKDGTFVAGTGVANLNAVTVAADSTLVDDTAYKIQIDKNVTQNATGVNTSGLSNLVLDTTDKPADGVYMIETSAGLKNVVGAGGAVAGDAYNDQIISNVTIDKDSTFVETGVAQIQIDKASAVTVGATAGITDVKTPNANKPADGDYTLSTSVGITNFTDDAKAAIANNVISGISIKSNSTFAEVGVAQIQLSGENTVSYNNTQLNALGLSNLQLGGTVPDAGDYTITTTNGSGTLTITSVSNPTKTVTVDNATLSNGANTITLAGGQQFTLNIADKTALVAGSTTAKVSADYTVSLVNDTAGSPTTVASTTFSVSSTAGVNSVTVGDITMDVDFSKLSATQAGGSTYDGSKIGFSLGKTVTITSDADPTKTVSKTYAAGATANDDVFTINGGDITLDVTADSIIAGVSSNIHISNNSPSYTISLKNDTGGTPSTVGSTTFSVSATGGVNSVKVGDISMDVDFSKLYADAIGADSYNGDAVNFDVTNNVTITNLSDNTITGTLDVTAGGAATAIALKDTDNGNAAAGTFKLDVATTAGGFVRGTTLYTTVKTDTSYDVQLKTGAGTAVTGSSKVTLSAEALANPINTTNVNLGNGVTVDLDSAALAVAAAGTFNTAFTADEIVTKTAVLQNATGTDIGVKYTLSPEADAKTLDMGKGVSFTYNNTVTNGDYSFTIEKNTTADDFRLTLTKDGTDKLIDQQKVDPNATVDLGNGLTIDTAVTMNAGDKATFEIIEGTKDDSLTMQIGANMGQTFSVDINDMRAEALGISGNAKGAVSVKDEEGNTIDGATYSDDPGVTNGTNNNTDEHGLDVSDANKASAAIKVIDVAIQTVSTERSKLGAFQNRLEHTINNLGTSSENLTAAESRVRDVDMAKEMMEFTKNNILSQAAQAMLAQANQQPQGVLQLLR